MNRIFPAILMPYFACANVKINFCCKTFIKNVVYLIKISFLCIVLYAVAEIWPNVPVKVCDA